MSEKTQPIFYFGCWHDVGHFMRAPNKHADSHREAAEFAWKNPWSHDIDGRLCPDGSQIEGRALIHHKEGWTALSFWDRSVDKRRGSNSNFLAKGDHSFETMLTLAEEYFPDILKRYSFQIVDASTPKETK